MMHLDKSSLLAIFARMAKKGEVKKYLYITLAVVGILLLAAGFKTYEDVLSPNVNVPEGQTAILYVHTGENFETLARNIDGKKVLRNTDALKRIVKLLGYEGRIKPGRYVLQSDMGNMKIIRLLVSGRQEPINVVFKYAERKQDLASFWGRQLEADSSEILRKLNDPAFAAIFDLDTQNVISLFLPNTYNFYWNTSAYKLLDRVGDEYEKFWDSVRMEKAEELGLTKAQVSVMASIVQKETNKVDEMPLIAGVYYNRLKKGMPFQADPTIIYAMNDRSIKRVAGAMLQVESPYNTYRRAGLPPGPICVASVQAINAVLNLKKHRYIYFCAKDNLSGYHNFAESFAQHQVNARKFQRALNKLGIH